MLSLGALAFAAPWILGALAALPILWWLLKLTPPAARLTHFPAVRFLLNIPQDEETPARTPLWLVILRFSLAALIILALAHPILNPSSRLGGSGPLLLVVDNGWAAAQHWQARQHMMADLIDQAERAERSVILLATAPPASGEPIHPTSVMRASAARRATQFLRPQPWPTDHEAAVRAVAELAAQGSVNVWWLSDGLADAWTEELAEQLQRLGRLTFVRDRPAGLARMLLPPIAEGPDFSIRARRAEVGTPDQMLVTARAADGRILLRESLRFEAEES